MRCILANLQDSFQNLLKYLRKLIISCIAYQTQLVWYNALSPLLFYALTIPDFS